MTQISIDQRITRFIKRHHVLTLATTQEDQPHCCNLFYAYSAAANYFVVISAEGTLHSQQLAKNAQVAASIVLESKVIGRLQGLQLRGTMTRPTPDENSEAKKLYLKRFPYAAAMPLEMWVIRPNYLKMTDNTLGFGTKLIWPSDNQ